MASPHPSRSPTPAAAPGRVVLLTQVYVPDTTAVGQHFHDVMTEMARRGHQATVYTSDRAYNDPSVRYPAHEWIDGVEIVRLPFTSFGKKTVVLRLLGAGSFLVQATLRSLFTRKYDHLVVSTSPPMCIVIALIASLFRRFAFTYWAMDLSPEHLVVLGKLRADSSLTKLLDRLNVMVLRRADTIVALDDCMAARLEAKAPIEGKVAVIPPWPSSETSHDIPHEANAFRKSLGLGDGRIVMYSGNHGLGLPLETLLEAALEFRGDERIAFVFIGDGIRKAEVVDWISRHDVTNARALPYQPLADVHWSLSAADVHLVSVGEGLSGIIHPCKIYGAMAVSRPILLLGPIPNYASDLVESNGIGWLVPHGDAGAMRDILRQIIDADGPTLAAMGARARQVIDSRYRKTDLVGQVCDRIEAGAQAATLGLPQ
jgi:colanic acid biosynthesis glycosyl transferase WcaI